MLQDRSLHRIRITRVWQQDDPQSQTYRRYLNKIPIGMEHWNGDQN